MGRLKVLGLLLVIAAGMSQSGRCELATAVEMEQVCNNWLLNRVEVQGSWAGEPNPTIVGSHDISVGDTVLARWYDIYPKGYVLVSTLKEMTPVKAYSDESSLDDSQEGGFLALIRETSSDLFRRYVSEYGSLESTQAPVGDAVFGRSQKALWGELTVSTEKYRSNLRAAARAAQVEAGPLTTSSWHQRAPYNDLCPMGHGGRCVVGCVATAAAQILKYWQWPPSGYGTHTYTWDGDQSCGGNVGGGPLTADFSPAIDWANIPDNCDGGCTPAQSTALARLCSDVGIAFNMNYGACGSAASVSYAAYVFPAYYKYSPEARVEERANFDLVGWFQLIQREIDSGRVIDYRINLHSIVCDGYRQQGSQYQFHMNYGWADDHTAWYVLDSLYCSWKPNNLCPFAEEFMVTHIKPQTVPVLTYVSSSVVDVAGNNDGHAQGGETISLVTTVRNDGLDAASTAGTLASADPYLTITAGTTSYGDLGWGAQGSSQPPYAIQISPSCPDPHIAMLEHSVTSASGGGSVDTALLFVGNTVGFGDDMESGQGFWTHEVRARNSVEQWHLESYRPHGGTASWKAGGAGAANYADHSDAGLITPPFLVPRRAKLTFWHRIDAEQNDDTTAWDAALVMISTGVGEWEALTPVGGYPYKTFMATTIPDHTPCYSGSHDWAQAEFDLSAYSGVAQIMFRFVSDDMVNFEGWYIDDVRISNCCIGLSGNVDCDPADGADISDLTALIDNLYISFSQLCCPQEANVDGSSDGNVDISDLTALIDYLYISFSLPTMCR